MEYIVIILFSLILLGIMLLKMPLLYALGMGLLLFFSYGLYKGYAAKELLQSSLEGLKSLGNLLMIFAFIGMLTATWRASGTIAFLVVNSTFLLIPSLFIFSSFLLCAFISMLTGTAFGTSATMGIICMTMGNILHLDPAYLGGAILSGCYFGDRMSPMSSSAHLIAKITRTDIFTNIKSMFTSCLVATILAGALYWVLGLENSGSDIPLATLTLFENNFNLAWFAAIPAIFMIILAVCKIGAKSIMLVSIISASILCVFLQDMSVLQLLRLYWHGFESHNPQMQTILGGGGLSSMLTVSFIVAISSSYVGIFNTTHFFDNIHKHICTLSRKITPFGSTIAVALLTCMMTCNQTLSIFLTKSLCEKQYRTNEGIALAIENTAVLMAALVPWNIASSVVLANINAPISSTFYAFFLYMVPAVSFFIFKKKAL